MIYRSGCILIYRPNQTIPKSSIEILLTNIICILSFVHYTISLSSLCKLIWRHGIYKMSVKYIFVQCVSKISIFSQLSIIQFMGLRVFSLPISLVMIDGIYILCHIIINKSEVWTIIHCLGSGHETMVCALCLAIFLFNTSGWSLDLE